MWKRQHIPDSVQKTCIHLQMITLLSVAEWQCGAYESHLQKIFFRSTKKTPASTGNFNQCLIFENYDTVKLVSLKLTNHIKRILKYRFLCIT